ncbi:Putative signal-transduction protein [Rheinheimera sp. A13L]|uniref:CBS domain-containing protein n=1 Tax=Rheinheimera sp. A13L TaxID=506534 RepID=UPI0002124C18|nr:CBS domain-containing protein [Rheinheimera sp. A13L]EGM77578.1 Putative signal-transduction protein [Rheinheimera sp. A13L]
MKQQLVNDLMVRQVISISAFAPIREALLLMKTHKVKCLVVDRQSVHDAYGIITYSHILKTIIAEQGDIDLINVYDVCTKPAIHVHSELAVKHAAELLTQHKIKRLLVLDNNQLVGLLTMDDLVSNVFRLLD